VSICLSLTYQERPLDLPHLKLRKSSALYFHNFTNCFSRKPCLFKSIQIPRGVWVSQTCRRADVQTFRRADSAGPIHFFFNQFGTLFTLVPPRISRNSSGINRLRTLAKTTEGCGECASNFDFRFSIFDAKSFRFRSYGKSARKSFRFRSYEILPGGGWQSVSLRDVRTCRRSDVRTICKLVDTLGPSVTLSLSFYKLEVSHDSV